ncbi:MAG TPA: cysteine synthase A [Erysipelothrix sp.]|nr:cysteine synthase A [Erysipelothrix sp.]
MKNVKQTVVELVGSTPLVQLNRLMHKHSLTANLIVKVELFNPAGSVKDRIAKSMIEAAEEAGVLKPGFKIVEATSGNTGIGLAAIGAAKGYEVILVMPDTMTVERRKFMSGYGAQFVLTDGALGMKGAMAKALEMQQEDETVFIPSQFDNLANVRAHYSMTGPEIFNDLEGQVDVVVSGIGTGGTITGIAQYLNEKGTNTKFVAVEPTTSAVLSGNEPGKHGIQGIGAGFVPSILDTEAYDEIIQISTEQAIESARELARTEGLLVGISSGAALAAGIELASREELKDKNIVVVLPDSGDRYLSTPLFD